MEIKLTTDIKELLIEDGAISIPNFGGFTSAYKPAVVDAVNGQLTPPSFHIAFDANLQMNDGRLVDHIRQKYRLSSSAALEHIEVFANEARRNFDKGEIVVLPEIGRLYRDFAQKIQFLPDSTNFNTDSYGLPTIQFTPILRNKFEAINKAATTDTASEPQASTPPVTPTLPRQEEQLTPSVNQAAAATSAAFASNESAKSSNEGAKSIENQTVTQSAPVLVETLGGVNSAQFPSSMDSVKPPTTQPQAASTDFMGKMRLMLNEHWRTLLPATVAIAVLGFLIWQLSSGSTPNTEGSSKARSLEPKENVSPLEGTNGAPKENVAPPIDGNINTQLPNNQQDITTITSPEMLSESPKSGTTATRQPNVTPSESGKKATILIGGFGNKQNIKKLKAWITSKGYGIYERPSGGLTLIGCEVNYETKADLQKTMTLLRNKFGGEIELIKR